MSSPLLVRTPVIGFRARLVYLESLHHLERPYFQVHILRFQVVVNLGEHYSASIRSRSEVIGSAGMLLLGWAMLLHRTILSLVTPLMLPGDLDWKNSDSLSIKLGP